jgi:hypothetical protein
MSNGQDNQQMLMHKSINYQVPSSKHGRNNQRDNSHESRLHNEAKNSGSFIEDQLTEISGSNENPHSTTGAGAFKKYTIFVGGSNAVSGSAQNNEVSSNFTQDPLGNGDSSLKHMSPDGKRSKKNGGLMAS